MAQPPPLESLMKQAREYALFSMKKQGRVIPTLLASTPKGPLHFLPSHLQDEEAKDNFATVSRMICAAHDVSALVMVLESWMKMAKEGESLDMNEAPSESIDRQEVVVLMGEEEGGKQSQQILPIVRSGNGKFWGFGDVVGQEMSGFEGRFAGLLPPRKPGVEEREALKVMLKVMGVTESRLRGKR